MENTQPKKRGRKKKALPEIVEKKIEIKDTSIDVEKTVRIPSISKQELMEMHERASKELNTTLMPENIVGIMHERISKNILKDRKLELFDIEFRKIYQRMKAKISEEKKTKISEEMNQEEDNTREMNNHCDGNTREMNNHCDGNTKKMTHCNENTRDIPSNNDTSNRKNRNDDSLDNLTNEFICDFSGTDKNNTEMYKWRNLISQDTAKSLCKVIDFLLQNGPFNKTEEVIFTNCTEAIQSYYAERFHFITENPEVNKELTYFPERNSCVFKYLVDVMKIEEMKKMTVT